MLCNEKVSHNERTLGSLELQIRFVMGFRSGVSLRLRTSILRNTVIHLQENGPQSPRCTTPSPYALP